jgi:hypothetical protein
MEDLLAGLGPRSRYSAPSTSMWGETTIAKAVSEESGPAHEAAVATAVRTSQSGTMLVSGPASGSRRVALAPAPAAAAPMLEKTSLFRRVPLRVRFEILGVLLLCAAFFLIQVWLIHSNAASEAQIISAAATPRPAHTPTPRPTPPPVPPQEMASLLVKVVHAFHNADLIIWVDGHAVDTARLTGGTVVRKKLRGKTVVSTHYEHYEKVIPVSAQEHTIRVRVSSKGYRQTKEIRGGFAPKGEDILAIYPSHELRLEWQ